MHFLSLKEWNGDALRGMLMLGLKIKKDPGPFGDVLKGKILVMIFEKTSTRTRISFEAGCHMMGGHAIFLESRVSNMQLSELKDEVRYISRNCQIIMARMLKNEDVQILAQYSHVPVINGCCNMYHPCQSMADMLTIYELFGRWEGLTLTYVGMRNNVSNDLLAATTKLGMRFIQVTPISTGYPAVPGLDDVAEKTGLWVKTSDLQDAVRQSDIVYTDTWVDMEFFNNPAFADEKEMRIRQMMPYQINGELLKVNPKIRIMHDMPIHTGYEISREAIESENAVIFQQAENRMWAQNGVMLRLLGIR